MSSTLCDSCKALPARYNCPGCSIRTCSLQCSKTHKLDTGCSGKRNPVTFIPRSKFNDASINNDYNFLTALERDLDNAARKSSEGMGGRQINQIRAFVKRAKDVGEVTVRTAPRGMKRSRLNTSAWVPKKGQLSWTVEWIFEGAEKQVSQRILASTILADAVEAALNKVRGTISSLSQIPSQELHYFIKDESGGTTEDSYTKLKPEQTIAESLRHRTVVEFPTIYVYTEIPEHLRHAISTIVVDTVVPVLHASRIVETSRGSDFIAFDVTQVADWEAPEATNSTSINGLPLLDFDDLEVPI